jgi:hypothetical protein
MPECDGHRFELLAGSGALPLAARVWACYDQVFGDFADLAIWRSELFERHAGREGYRLAAATIDDDQVIGFAWGYVGQRGQYWCDLVHDALPQRSSHRGLGATPSSLSSRYCRGIAGMPALSVMGLDLT